MSAGDPKPKITYPCSWEFKVIGFDTQRVREAVARVVGDAAHSVADSRQSSSGKYRSVSLTMTVHDEAHRNRIFAAFRDHKDVVMVI